jgi:hypothetical protein
MLSLISNFIILIIILIAVLILFFKKKIELKVTWLEVLFVFCFLSSLIIMLYYRNYYLGESQILQKVYLSLFYLSVLFLVVAIILRVIRGFRTK